VTGLAAQKKKVGFLERLANVARHRKEPDAEMPTKREPEFGGHFAAQPAEAPKLQTARPQSLSPAPKGLRIERPRSEQGPAAAPKRVEMQPRPIAVEMAEASVESLADDDLEIPAFLRRRAN
jgi:hypothetical protein